MPPKRAPQPQRVYYGDYCYYVANEVGHFDVFARRADHDDFLSTHTSVELAKRRIEHEEAIIEQLPTPAESRVQVDGGHYERRADGWFDAYCYLNPGRRDHVGTVQTEEECVQAIRRVLAESSPAVENHAPTNWIAGGELARTTGLHQACTTPNEEK